MNRKSRSPIRGVSGKDGGSCLTKPVGEIIIRAIFELAIRPVNIGHGMKEEQH